MPNMSETEYTRLDLRLKQIGEVLEALFNNTAPSVDHIARQVLEIQKGMDLHPGVGPSPIDQSGRL